MRVHARPVVLASVVAVALAFGTGCGSNNSNNEVGGPQRTATPTVAALTPTPTVTPTPPPVAGNTNVTFNLSSGETINTVGFDVAYDPANGSFAGAGNTTDCDIDTADALNSNDDDNGLLRNGINADDNIALVLPANVTCLFEGTVVAGDLTVQNVIVGQLDENGIPVAGDPNAVTIQVSTAPAT